MEMSTVSVSPTTQKTFTSPVPFWGTIIIGIGACIFLLALFSCFVLCLCRRGNKRKKVSARGLPVIDPFDKFSSHKSFVQQDVTEQLPTKNLGILHFTLDYSLKDKKLSVGVVKIDNLPGSVLSKPSMPYVRVRLYPDLKTFDTKHVNFSHNPIFHESFDFPLSPEKQTSSVVIFTVYDFQVFSKHKRISQLHLPLKNVLLNSIIEDFAALDEPSDTFEITELGDVCVSLKYVPSQSKLVVVVIEAKNLSNQDPDYKEPYVKLYLKANQKTLKKKKTTKNTAITNNPYFNESFEFELSTTQVKHASLLIRVAYKTGLGRSRNIGEVLLGLSVAGGSGNGHWTNIINSPGQPYALWHSLTCCNE